MHDLKLALRQLLKHRGFTAVVVVTLTLGIGANTAIFSLVSGILLKSPYDDPDQLVQVWEDPGTGARKNTLSPGVFLDWQTQNTTFEGLSLANETNLNFTGSGEPERLEGLRMSANGLSLLRAKPLLGRTFAPDEDRPGKNNVLVLTERLWQRRFGADPNIVGRTVELNLEPHTVIGVLPANFLPSDESEYVVPFPFPSEHSQNRGMHYLRAIGRLKSGITVAQARAELNTIADRMRMHYPQSKKRWGATVVPLHEEITGEIAPTLWILVGAVGFVLLIACTNVANLLLARAFARRKDVAIQLALGASRWRVIRPLLVESLLLSLAGALAGLGLAWALVDNVGRLSVTALPRIQEVSLDWRVLGFTLIVSLLTGTSVGLFPALQATRPDLERTLKEGGRTSVAGSRGRMRGALIVSQVALALVLLAGAGLLLRSFLVLSSVEPGFVAEKGVAMQISLPQEKYSDVERRLAFFDRALDRVRALPGVEVAGVSTSLPVVSSPPDTGFRIVGRQHSAEAGYGADFNACTPDWFRAMGIPLVKGRFFTERDTVRSTPVVIVTDALMRKYFPDQEVLGQHLEIGEQTWEIVGVVADTRYRGLAHDIRPMFYRPFPFSSAAGGHLVVRSAVVADTLVQIVRRAILDVDPNQPVANIRTLETVLDISVGQRRLMLLLLGFFAAVALTLAAVGLYGVAAYAVNERTQEIGLRMALGADRRNVTGMILRQGMQLAVLGALLGTAGALAMTRVMRNVLYQIEPHDPVTFVGILVITMVVTLTACVLPARRAARIDPLTALRSE
jgi:predicted permease